MDQEMLVSIIAGALTGLVAGVAAEKYVTYLDPAVPRGLGSILRCTLCIVAMSATALCLTGQAPAAIVFGLLALGMLLVFGTVNYRVGVVDLMPISVATVLIAATRPIALDVPWYDGLAPAAVVIVGLLGKRWLDMRKGPESMAVGFIGLMALATAVSGIRGVGPAMVLGMSAELVLAFASRLGVLSRPPEIEELDDGADPAGYLHAPGPGMFAGTAISYVATLLSS